MDETIEGLVTRIIKIGNHLTPAHSHRTEKISTEFELQNTDGETRNIVFPMQIDPSVILSQRVKYTYTTGRYMGSRDEYFLEILDGEFKGLIYNLQCWEER